jgi:hypothetical protein
MGEILGSCKCLINAYFSNRLLSVESLGCLGKIN